jgi:hypothetical protein
MNEALTREYVKGLVQTYGITGAARLLAIAEGTVSRLVYGVPVARGTLANVELVRLRAISGTPLPTT